MRQTPSPPPVTTPSERARRRRLGDPGRFSSARTFSPPVGAQLRAGELGGYYIDFTVKTDTPEWPPFWLKAPEKQIHVATAQWGLGCFERYLRGEGEAWLAAATAAADHLMAHQERGGAHDGGWVHGIPMPHTYDLSPPWLSGMAQGEGASLLVRIHREVGDERYAEAATLALKAFDRSTADGGVRARLGQGFFLEEYPTDPPSFVLNGGIFALWGCLDVAVALGDEHARRSFDEGVETLEANLARWDTGRWSRYDLYPHPVTNITSSAYHLLHTTQLRAMALVTSRGEFESTADRFASYSQLARRRREAFARKVAFRLMVPRNSVMAYRMPFGPRRTS